MQLLKAQLPVIQYDSGKIAINGIAVSKSTPKSTLEELLGSKAWSGNLAHLFKDLGISLGWYNRPPHNLECTFVIQKSKVDQKRRNDKTVAFPGKVFIGSLLFDKNLNLKNFETDSNFKIIAINMGTPASPFTLISYQNTLLKCYFDTDGYLLKFGTYL
jgi:hypothetical protein